MAATSAAASADSSASSRSPPPRRRRPTGPPLPPCCVRAATGRKGRPPARAPGPAARAPPGQRRRVAVMSPPAPPSRAPSAAGYAADKSSVQGSSVWSDFFSPAPRALRQGAWEPAACGPRGACETRPPRSVRSGAAWQWALSDVRARRCMSTAARSPVVGARKPAGCGLLPGLPRLHLLVGVALVLVCRCIRPWDCSCPALRVMERRASERCEMSGHGDA